MKVRAIANGNIIDLPEGHSLIAAGIYVPVNEQPPVDNEHVEAGAQRFDEATIAASKPKKATKKTTKKAEQPANTAVAPIGTADFPTRKK